MNNPKLLVFEGISGSGKSTVINNLSKRCAECEVTDWFSTESFRHIASNIQNHMKASHDLYSLIYALEYYSRMERIKSEDKKITYIFAHRYIYTPKTHDYIRGSDSSLLDFLYDDLPEPDLIFYFDIKPEDAYKRIISYRKPSFYECGFDILYFDDLNMGKKVYAEQEGSSVLIKSSFLDFQQKVCDKYNALFKDKQNVIRVPGKFTIENTMDLVNEAICRIKSI